MIRFLFIYSLFSLASLSVYAQMDHTTVLEKFSVFYEQELRESGVIGSSVMILQGNDLIHEQHYGLADKDEDRPIDEKSVFHWASVTKTFTGIAIMQLRDRGLLDLDDSVTKYIPELRKVHNPFGSMDDITIRHLMTHTSGFRSPTWPWNDPDKKWQPHEPQYWDQIESMFPYTEIKFKPGSGWNYSNPAIIFLGRIIELITNDDYEYYMDKNVLDPLKMFDSYFDNTPYRLLPRLVQSYYYTENGEYEKARFDLNTGITVSNGGLSSPLSDMAKYLAFLTGNAGAEAYETVLKQSSLEEMYQQQARVESEYYSEYDSVGLTFFIEETNGMKLIGHSGNQNGFINRIFFDPKSGMAYAAGYNTSGSQRTRNLDTRIKEFIFEHIFTTITCR